MLYRDYREKLTKRAQAFERVWRLRFVFLAIFLLMLATAATLMGVKGIVHDVVVPESIVYGESLGASASSVFDEARLEYRAKGGEWTQEEPRLVGEYECRAVGNSVVGTDRPSEVFSYRIVPAVARVGVGVQELVYGEYLPFYTNDLKYHDELVVEGYLSEPLVGQLKVEADQTRMSVYNEAGEDVTFCYTFETKEEIITDLRRPILVRTESDVFEYDGKPHSCETFEVLGDGLIAGHTFHAEFPTLTEAGTCANALDKEKVSILDENGEDVTGKYRIEYEPGTLTVNRRKIAVETVSETLTYDGLPHSYPDVALKSGTTLAEGQEFSLTDTLTATDADTYQNAPKVFVFAGEEDVTKNYEIETHFGTVKIEKRKLTLKTVSEERVYDGGTHVYEVVSIEGGTSLAAQEQLSVKDFLEVRDVGEYDNAPDVSILAGERDVTGNYEIERDFGKVVVKKREITLSTKDVTLRYDGQDHIYNEIEVSEGELALGQTLEVTGELKVSNAATYQNAPNFAILADGERVTDNYEITKDFGKIVIEKRPVTLTTEEDTFAYDGKAHKYDTVTVSGEPALPEGQGIIVTEPFAALDANTYTNAPQYFISSDGTESGKDVTNNYEITKQFGKVTVEKRKVVLTTKSADWTYDGTEHESIWNVTEGIASAVEGNGDSGLAVGHSLKVEGHTPLIGHTESADNEVSYIICDASGNAVTDNYDPQYVYGKVTIAKRPISFEAKSETFIYDGKEHIYDEKTLTYSETDLAVGQKVIVADPLKIIDQGTYPNDSEGSIHIYDASDGDRTENYEIGFTAGEVTVNVREVTVKPNSKSFVYNGEAQFEKGYTTGTVGLADGHELMFDSTPITEVGERENEFSNVRAVDAEGQPVKEGNYRFTLEKGALTVTQRPVYLETETNLNTVYDDTYRFWDGYSDNSEDHGAECGILTKKGHSLKVEAVTRLKDVCSPCDNVLKFTVRDAGGNDISNQYVPLGEGSAYVTYGRVCILPRPLHVTTESDTFHYDGVEHVYDENTFTLTESTTLANGHAFEIFGGDYTFTDANAAAYENKPQIRIVRSSDKANVTDQYDLGENLGEGFYSHIAYGEIKIDPRPVYIKSATNEWVYDGMEHGDGTIEIQPYMDGKQGSGILDSIGHKFTYKVQSFPTRSTVTEAPVENELSLDFRVEANGADVTENYNFITTWGTIKIDPRPVTFTTMTDSWVYDGTEHENVWNVTEGIASEVEGEDVSGLVGGHRLSVVEHTVFVICNDSGKNRIEYKVLDASGAAVTENYAIQYVYGEVTIKKRPVKFTTQDEEWTYDGTVHTTWDAYSVEKQESTTEDRGLITGHSVLIATKTEFREWKDTGDNIITFKISDGDGDDVTENYDPEHAYGTVTVTKRPISLQAKSETFTYDGAEHVYGALTLTTLEGDLASDQKIVIENPLTVIDQGKYRNGQKSSIHIYDAENADKTENYEIQFEEGEIVINPRPVTLTTKSADWVYDGTEHEDIWNVTEGIAGEAENEDDGGLVGGHYLTVKEYTTFIGYVENGVNKIEYIIHDAAEKDVTKNYKITYVYGTVTIEKRPIAFRTGDSTWMYDGVTHTYEVIYAIEGKKGEESYPLIEGHGYEYDISKRAEVTNVWETEDENNAIEFKVTISDASGNDVTENYEQQTTQYGKLTITARPIKLRTGSVSVVYDGKEHFNETVEIIEGEGEDGYYSLIAGHTIGFSEKKGVPHVKNVRNSCDNQFEFEYLISDAEGGKMNGNYELLGTEFGYISVSPRTIRLQTGSQTWVYDGEAHSNEEVGVYQTGIDNENYFDLAEGQTLFVSARYYVPSVTDVNTDRLPTLNGFSFDYDIYEAQSTVSAKANYDVKEIVPGRLSITPRPLRVQTGTDTFVYNGAERTVTEFELLPAADEDNFGLLTEKGHEIRVTRAVTRPVDVCEGVPNELVFAIYDGARDITFNYVDINSNQTENEYVVCGTVTITKRPLTIHTKNYTWVYDGLDHTELWDDTEGIAGKVEGVEESGLVDGHYLQISTCPVYVSVRENSVNNAVYSIYCDYGNVTENYMPIDEACDYVTYGTVNITKRPVVIYSGDDAFVYDGTEHMGSTAIAEAQGDKRGLLSGHAVHVLRANTVKDITDPYEDGAYTGVAGIRHELYEVEIIDTMYQSPVTDNYEITFENTGTLRVKSPIIIYLYETGKPYDGKPITFGERDYEIDTIPSDIPAEYVSVTIGATLTEIGSLTLREVRLTCRGEVIGADVGPYRFEFIDQNYLENDGDVDGELLTVYKCALTVTTGSLEGVRRKEGLTCNTWEITLGKLPDGFTLTCTVNGFLSYTADYAENTVVMSSLKIVDGNGRDVTSNFDVKFKYGILQWSDTVRNEPHPIPNPT